MPLLAGFRRDTGVTNIPAFQREDETMGKNSLLWLGAGLLLLSAGVAGTGAGSHLRRLTSNPVLGCGCSHPSTIDTNRAQAAYGNLPLNFEPNQGQTDARVKFMARGSGFGLFLTADEAVLALRKSAPRNIQGASRSRTRAELLRMRVLGARRRAAAEGLEPQQGQSHYLHGRDPQRWRTHIPLYARVRYRAVYPGIDLVYYGNQQQLEYDFVVAPGANPDRIRLAFTGARTARIAKNGDLLLGLRGGAVRWEKPFVYQERDGVREPVPGAYQLSASNHVGFSVGAYDRNRPLVIDPSLVYSSYLGGTIRDLGCAIDVDICGNAYITGITTSPNFPLQRPMDASLGGAMDAFITKVNPTGSALVYSTYLGGSGNDGGNGIAVDANGSAVAAGGTDSEDFPILNAVQPTLGASTSIGGGPPPSPKVDGFITKLTPDGSGLVYSTYYGGSDYDQANRVRLDGSGNAYIVGQTASPDFHTTPGAFQSVRRGPSDATIVKLTASGGLVYATLVGGSGADCGLGIAVDATGSAYADGWTSSLDFPVLSALQPRYGGGATDGFVLKLNASGSALAYSTFLGGAGNGSTSGEESQELAGAVDVDGGGNAYVAGVTNSANFPTTPGAFQTTFQGGLLDGFVAKIGATGSRLVYSTFLGGSGIDQAWAIRIDPSVGTAYVTGRTGSANFPTRDAVQPVYGGGFDLFATKLNATGSGLVWSTFLGGSLHDVGSGVAVDSLGSAYLTGYTASANFPTMNPFQPNLAGDYDCIAAKIGVAQTPNCQGSVGGPPPTNCGKVTGGGWIPLSNGGQGNHKATFGVHALCDGQGRLRGDLEYQDHETGMNVHGTSVTQLFISGTHARIVGTATINGGGSYNFVVDVDDIAEPGAGSDRFGIELSNGYSINPQVVMGGGNIQIH
jgi:hypothetical protein